MNTKSTTAIDVMIGNNIRAVRKLRGMSQEKLAEGIGKTFQQVQKYEKATNRVSCSTMLVMCRVLNCEPADIIGRPDGESIDVAESFLTREAELRDRMQRAIKVLQDG